MENTSLDELVALVSERMAVLAKASPAPEVKVDEAVVEVAAEPAAETVAKSDPKPVVEAALEAVESPKVEEPKAEEPEAFSIFGKSFSLEQKLVEKNGTEHVGLDGIAVIKAIAEEIDALRAKMTIDPAPAFDLDNAEAFKGVVAKAASLEENTVNLTKALQLTADALSKSEKAMVEQAERIAAQDARISEQEALIKSLSATVEKIGTQGVGRQSLLNVQDRPSNVTRPEVGMTKGEVFAKAETLLATGKISPADVASITAYANHGQGIPPKLQALFAA